MDEANEDQESGHGRNALLGEVAGLVDSGMTIEDASDLVGVYLHPGEDLPTRFGYVPTPDLVVEMMIRMQADWTPAERERRVVGPKTTIEYTEDQAA